MKNYKKYLGIAMVVGVALSLIVVRSVKANPIFFPPTYQTATATTTGVFIKAGLSTTTLIVDSYYTNSLGANTAYLKGILLIQYIASSTNDSSVRINKEYAGDSSSGLLCTDVPGACDWFEEAGSDVNNYATTSKPIFDLSQVSQYNLNFASTTVGGVTPTKSATTTRAIAVDLPTRYTRFVFSVPIGSQPAVIWAKFIGQKERQ